MKRNIIWNILDAYYYFFMILWGVLYFLIGLGYIKKKITAKQNRHFLIVSALVYYMILLFVTLFGRRILPEYRMDLGIFSEYKNAIRVYDNRMPIINKEWTLQIIKNIVLYIPSGIFFYEFLRKVRSKAFLYAVVLGGSISLFIELIQLLTRRGFFESSDILNNVLGVVGGYLLGKAMNCYINRVNNSKKLLIY